MHTTKPTPHQTDYHADKPLIIAPKIKRTFESEGLRMYETMQGAIYFADMYDNAFGVRRGVVNKNKNAKGINPSAVHNFNF